MRPHRARRTGIQLKGNGDVKITGEIVAMALNATGWHRSQLQVFTYNQAPSVQIHAVRDLTQEPELQTVSLEVARREEYQAAHSRALLAKEKAEANLIAERINVLIARN